MAFPKELTKPINPRIEDMRRIAYLLSLSLLFISCSDKLIINNLNDIESYIQEKPDSALIALKAIDTLHLSTKAEKAKYSLLIAMALDKNYIDTSDTRIIQPAIDYYIKHGSPDEKLKSYYHLGIIQSNKGDLNNSAISFSIAEEIAPTAIDDKYKGLLSMAFASLYDRIHNSVKELEYIEKGKRYFQSAGEETGYNLASYNCAVVYQSRQQWQKADSLYKMCLQYASKDSMAMPKILSNYARMKVLMPEIDPSGAISLLSRKYNEYKTPLSIKDYCIYAFASAANGDYETCNNILKLFEKLPERRWTETSYWEYRIASIKKDYPRAIELLNLSYATQDTLVSNLLNNTVEGALKEYYVNSAEKTKQKSRSDMLLISLIASLVILLLLILLGFARYMRNKERNKYEKMLRISEDTNKLLKQANTNLEKRQDSYDVERKQLLEKVDKSEANLSKLRDSFADLYKEKFAIIGNLCDAYLMTKNRSDKQELIYRRVQNQIACFIGDDKLHARFESQINHDLNNIVRHLRSDLPNLSQKDIRFLCYCFIGLEPEIISTLMDLSLSNVYTKKSRLKDKIRSLDSPYKDDYIRML